MKGLLKDVKEIKQKLIILNKQNRIYESRNIYDDKKLIFESLEELETKIKNLYLKK